MKSIAFHNLGCKVNAYETEAMIQEMAEAGYVIVPFTEQADIYVVNTCTVTNMADRKSRQMLHRAKKKNPQAVVAAVGCYAQEAGEVLLEDPCVDLVIGNNRKKDLRQILETYLSGGSNQSLLDISSTREYEEVFLDRVTDHTRAYMKIQDGCNQFCSYCIIPYARGRVRSRALSQIQAEARCMAEKGYQELVLTGIHLSSYGMDLEGSDSLITVLETLGKISGIRRIRLGSLEPRIITEEFLDRLEQIPAFCPHFHLSLQSGCEETLKRMNRKYTPQEYEHSCLQLRKRFPEAAITTDVIVGFPGETQEEFQESREFVRRMGFYEPHIFKYSRRRGTPADRMSDQVPEEVKNQRSEELIRLGKELSDTFRRQFLNHSIEVLFEEKIEKNGKEFYLGHTREYIKVAVETKEDLKNQIQEVYAIGMLNQEIMLAILEN